MIWKEEKKGYKREMELYRKMHKSKKLLQIRAEENSLYKDQPVPQNMCFQFLRTYTLTSDGNTDSRADCPLVICTPESYLKIEGFQKFISQLI